jgi:hypothetical protein
MSKGVLLIANNNSNIDYLLQAISSAKRIKKYTNLPVTLVTETPEILDKEYKTEKNVFDKVITLNPASGYTKKIYRDGERQSTSLDFKNTTRSRIYDLTPYDETLVLDTDVIVSNDIFLKCFEQKHDFLIYKKSFDVCAHRYIKEFDNIVDQGIEFYWATCVFFRKTATNEIFFNLIKHIHENYLHYKNLYYVTSGIFRNDFVFSIAIHIMNGYQKGDFAKSMPGTLYFSSDKDELVYLNDDQLILLLESTTNKEQSLVSLTKANVHVMNKFSIERILKNDS